MVGLPENGAPFPRVQAAFNCAAERFSMSPSSPPIASVHPKLPVAAPLRFPAALLSKTPTQIELACGEVQGTLLALEEGARTLGARLGVRFGPVELDAPTYEGVLQPEIPMLVRFLLLRLHQYSLDRIGGQWGLFYTPSYRGVAGPTVPLRDAPIEARMRFLDHSPEFFRLYLDASAVQLSAPKAAVARGQEALRLLSDIRPE